MLSTASSAGARIVENVAFLSGRRLDEIQRLEHALANFAQYEGGGGPPLQLPRPEQWGEPPPGSAAACLPGTTRRRTRAQEVLRKAQKKHARMSEAAGKYEVVNRQPVPPQAAHQLDNELGMEIALEYMADDTTAGLVYLVETCGLANADVTKLWWLLGLGTPHVAPVVRLRGLQDLLSRFPRMKAEIDTVMVSGLGNNLLHVAASLDDVPLVAW